MVESEIWRLIPSLPSCLVSSEGRIMVIPYEKEMPHGGTRQYGGYPHFGVWSKEDQRYVLVYKNKTYRVGRLICEAFHGPAPTTKSVAMHLDENPRNNKSHNLKWGTQKENLNAPGFIRYCCGRTGENNPYIKGRSD